MRSMMNSMEKQRNGPWYKSRHFGLDIKDSVRVSGEEHNQFIERMAGLSRQQVANQNAWYSEE